MCKFILKYGDNAFVIYLFSVGVLFVLTQFDTELILGTLFFSLGLSFATAFVFGLVVGLCDEI